MDDITRLGLCVRCGRPLDPGQDDICASCGKSLAETPTVLGLPTHVSEATSGDAPTIAGLPAQAGPMGTSSGSTSEHATYLSGPGSSTRPSGPGLRPTPGQVFGPYRVERPLGRGGMGDVYEADHLEHGRRVALKVLGQRLGTAEDRARFLREGELAALITHPNTVYIYGSEEIGGAPVIAMELLPGGTLKDLVQDRGALAPKQAVDLILQVIDGLEAAHAAGILHRDIKPANCFIDRDGGIKVGDFGLSISTVGRESGGSGFFQGTPQFAAPEQLRGEPLDVRADIYAVGATLFYLLTAHPPFDDPDLTTLIARVKDETPRSPREMREGVPDALASVVMRMLAKDRNDRPDSYAAVRDLLRAFSSSAAAPAHLGRRFLAGLLDQGAIILINIPIAMTFVFWQQNSQYFRWWVSIAQIGLSMAYFAILEGLWGAALGKRICGIEVATVGGQRPGVTKAAARAIFHQLTAIASLVPMAIIGAGAFTEFTLVHPGVTLLATNGLLALQLALLFSTARRSNGFAAVQDLVTGTRVVRRAVRIADATASRTTAFDSTTIAGARQFGPFAAMESMGRADDAVVWAAVDPRLKRHVWVLERPLTAAAVSPVVREANRPGRARWLGGRRAETEAWDAFEAFDGAALSSLNQPQPWQAVRRWLLDLSVEIESGLQNESLPPLSIDRVWITRAGHAKLLEFRTSQGDGSALRQTRPVPVTFGIAQAWLADVAAKGLSGAAADPADVATWPPNLSLSARALVDKLVARGYAGPKGVIADIRALMSTPDVITPWRRWLSVGLGGVVTVIFTLLGLIAAFMIRRAPIGVEALAMDLKRIADLQRQNTAQANQQREALEVYVASTYRQTMANELTWSISSDGTALREYRPLGNDVLARHPTVTAEELAAAKTTMGSFLVDENKARASSARRAQIGVFVVPTFMFFASLGITAICAIVLAVVFKGGLLLRAFGIAVVSRAGAPASRGTAALRGLVTWLPAVGCALAMWAADIRFSTTFSAKHPSLVVLAGVLLFAFIAGAVFAAMRSDRGLQDYLARTRLVPR